MENTYRRQTPDLLEKVPAVCRLFLRYSISIYRISRCSRQSYYSKQAAIAREILRNTRL